MIDANANRAAEAARTLEDLARFVLDRSDIAANLKSIRHRVASALDEAGWDAPRRSAERDTPGDVGTGISTAREAERPGLVSVASAASSRLGEALRCLEELSKLTSRDAAAVIEQARYRAYDAAAAVISGLTRPSASWRLCVLMTESLCNGRDWLKVAESAIAGGADCLQLREKSLDDRELLSRAKQLIGLARPHGCAVIVNDRPDIAVLADADGVHVGQDDLPCADARRIVGPHKLVGVSCSTADQARAAVEAGADVLGLGPMFESTTKPKPRLAGIALLEAVLNDSATATVPHLAISGIDAARARELGSIGCSGIAVASAVTEADDPADAAQKIVQALMESQCVHHTR